MKAKVCKKYISRFEQEHTYATVHGGGRHIREQVKENRFSTLFTKNKLTDWLARTLAEMLPNSCKINFVSVCLLHFLSSSPQVCFSSFIPIFSSFFLALFFSLTIPLHIYFSSCFFSFSHLYHLFTVFSGRRWLLPPSLRRRPRPTTSLTSSWTRWTKIHFQTRRWKTVRIWIICLRKASLYWMNFWRIPIENSQKT